MKHIFLVNSVACDGKAGPLWKSIEHKFREGLADVEVLYPETAEACQDMASNVARSGEQVCIVTVGGEGTMNRALNGIMDGDVSENVSMALVPFGNVNDYGANIGLKKKWQHALAALKAGRTAKVGVIRLNADGKTEYALNIADIGFGATTAKSHSVDHQLSWLKGQFKYNMLALKTLLKWNNVPARIIVDEETITGDIAILLVGFSRTLGGFYLAPHAKANSDTFAVTIGLNTNRLQILGLIEASKKNKLTESENIYFRQAQRVLVESDKPLVAEVDGEIVTTGSTKILFEALPKALNFVIPADSPLIG